MPPAWKTFDEQTAAALKDRVDEARVSVESITQPLFAGGDSVVIAPTLQKGAALVITARTKPAPVIEEPVQFTPLIEEIAAPETSTVLEHALEPVVTPEPPIIEPPLPKSSQDESELTFGPTTWERVDEVEIPGESSAPERQARSTDPEIWDLPSQALPRPSGDPSTEQPPANSDWEEERYVATGFLGLEDYVEDEQEIARTKRPWWKRIFSD